jgi:hypothetical protein
LSYFITIAILLFFIYWIFFKKDSPDESSILGASKVPEHDFSGMNIFTDEFGRDYINVSKIIERPRKQLIYVNIPVKFWGQK